MRTPITIIGGGLAGLTAAIACAEQGAPVILLESHDTLGGRARSTDRPYVVNEGPHAFYSDGEPFHWLAERKLVQPFAQQTVRTLMRSRFRHRGRLIAVPPVPLMRMLARRSVVAPVDLDFETWATKRFGTAAAQAACGFMGVVTYSAEVSRLSAAFVWERLLRVGAPRKPSVRYPVGGWSRVIERMAGHARSLGVQITTGVRADKLPEAPVIVATGLDTARRLLGDDTLRWTSGHAVLLDLSLRSNRDDLFLVSDLDAGAFVEQFSMIDSSLAPAGHSVVQAALPTHDDEQRAEAVGRLEQVVELGMPGWRERVAWRREASARGRTGALDLPGETWADRPAIERGDGVWLIGDSVAAPGILSEVAVNSARTAARAAVWATAAGSGHTQPA
jgi:phytoene dehydrogenase-like protein